MRAKHQTKKQTASDRRSISAPLEHLQDAVFIIEIETRAIRYCNPAAEKMFDYSASELSGKTTEVLHLDREHYQQFGKSSERAIDRERVYRGHTNMRRRDGTPFPTSHVVGVLGFFRPKTTIIAESPAIRGLQEGIAFSEVHIYTNFG